MTVKSAQLDLLGKVIKNLDVCDSGAAAVVVVLQVVVVVQW